ncbi:endonuclease/exonuclease/phosphatase family protein [Fodinicola acaciae]|uniref:endonuclease/exonuclease/phosphatase family protein n=1 Tax=Fodinicola acaciae TaxID=2681555 RepID=UPI0013D6EBB7|nr:endonuclease/exonuclease/phosphatase family protein [Fodinicola acaciae]
MSDNVRGMRDDYAALTRVIREARPHVVFVQESPLMFRWRARAADLARRSGLVYVCGGGYSGGNVILSSVAARVHESRDYLMPLQKGKHQRGAAIARLSVLGREFYAVGTHLSLWDEEREEQAHLLADEVPDDLPVLLGGDLNETPGGPVTKIFGVRWRDASASRSDPPTYSTVWPHQRLDYLWVDPLITVRDVRVIDSVDARRASDHFPLVAEVELPA